MDILTTYWQPGKITIDPLKMLLSHLKTALFLQVFTTDNESRRQWKLLLLLFNSLLYNFIYAINLDTYFVMNLPLCWGVVMIGIYSAVLPSVAAVGSIVFSKLLTYFLSDAFAVVVGLIIILAGNVFKYFVTTTVMMLASMWIHLDDF